MKRHTCVLFLLLSIPLVALGQSRVTLSGSQKESFYYHVEAGHLPVFTLKRSSGFSDFDLYLYSDQNRIYQLDSSTNSGYQTELIALEPVDYDRYVYIDVKNYGAQRATYNLYVHQVPLIERLGEVFARTVLENLIEVALLGDDPTEQAERNASRATTLLMAALQDHDLGETSLDLLLNEFTTALRQEMGYGFWGDFMVNYVVTVIREIYQYY